MDATTHIRLEHHQQAGATSRLEQPADPAEEPTNTFRQTDRQKKKKTVRFYLGFRV